MTQAQVEAVAGAICDKIACIRSLCGKDGIKQCEALAKAALSTGAKQWISGSHSFL